MRDLRLLGLVALLVVGGGAALTLSELRAVTRELQAVRADVGHVDDVLSARAAPRSATPGSLPYAAPRANGPPPAAESYRARPSADSIPAAASEAEVEADVMVQVPDQRVLAAIDRANLILDSALDRRAWTAEDRAAFNAEMGQLPADEAMNIIRELIQAVNQGEVEVRTVPLL